MPDPKEKILVVDDAINLLNSFKRQFRKQYDVHTAENGEEGLAVIKSDGPFSVIISDMEMPVMNGAEFLAKAKVLAPNTVRMLLTGQTNIKSAISAVNHGQIFRFMEKPCSPESVQAALDDAIEQYHLQTVEKNLMDQTVKGVIGLLAELLSQLKPQVFSYGLRSKEYIRYLISHYALSSGWEFEIAAMMSELGAVSLDNSTLKKVYFGGVLDISEQEEVGKVANLSAGLIERIPRLENVAQMIQRQNEFFEFPKGTQKLNHEQRLKLGGHMIKCVREFDRRIQAGEKQSDVIAAMLETPLLYNHDLIKVLGACSVQQKQTDLNAESPNQIYINNLQPGMVLECDIRLKDYTLIHPQGFEVTETTLASIQENLGEIDKEDTPVRVVQQ